MPDPETCWRLFWALWLIPPVAIWGGIFFSEQCQIWPEEYLILVAVPVIRFIMFPTPPTWSEIPNIGSYPAHVVILGLTNSLAFLTMIYISAGEQPLSRSRVVARCYGLIFFGGTALLYGLAMIWPPI